MDILKQFGHRVKLLRMQKGVSQEKLAELAGLHRTYISSVESGKRNVSLVNLVALATALGVPIELLLSNIGEYKNSGNNEK